MKPFNYVYWTGMLTGLDLIAESYENSHDLHELQHFLNCYRQTVADFRAAHSEHMEESLKNAGIGRETKGIL